MIAVSVLGGLQSSFGFKEAIPSRDRLEMNFVAHHPLTDPFQDVREKTLPLGRPGQTEGLGTYGYTEVSEPALATYPDGTADKGSNPRLKSIASLGSDPLFLDNSP